MLARHRACRRDRGAVALEFALVMPLLLMVLLGTITTSFVLSDHIAATNAVREAARYGSVADASSGAWAGSVQTRVQQVYFNAASTPPSASQVCVALVSSGGATLASAVGSGCGPRPTLPSGMASGSCAVLVWMRKPEKIDLGVVPTPAFSIGAQSVAYYGRTVGTLCTAA